MSSTRIRTPKKRDLKRGEPVIRGILAATLEGLARVGYAALRIEDVAARAAVNKTTVYRRWPTKEDLVRGALIAMAGDKLTIPDTGSLEGDLLEIGRCMVRFGDSPLGKSVSRMMVLEGPDSELMDIVRSLRDSHEHIPRSIMERAVQRGELASAKGTVLLLDALKATLHHRLFIERGSVDERFLRDLVHLLLHGVVGAERAGRSPVVKSRPAAPRAKRPRRASPARSVLRVR